MVHTAPRPQRRGGSSQALRAAAHWLMIRAAVLAMILYVIGPFIWMLLSSFETRAQLFSRPPTWFPPSLYLENYRRIISDPTLIQTLRNSGMVATLTAVASLTLGSLAAYAFARMRMPGRNVIFVFILATQMLPGIAVLVPLYITMRRLGLLFTYQGLVIAYLTFNLPYVIWLLRAFFVSIPLEIEEAARLDGCSRIGAILRVILPLSAPGFISTGIFAFVGAWNEFLIASVMTNNITKTFPVRMAQFIGEETTAFEHMFPAAVLGTIPVVILALVFQRYIISGLTEGGVKF